MSDIITQAANSYITTFQGYESIFKGWGETLFFSLLGINLVWIGLWCAIDRSSLPDAFSEFLKKFFIATVFYTILLHPEWAQSVMSGSEEMGNQLNGSSLDPSSIISKGIQIANLIIKPVNEMGLFDASFGLLIALVVYVATLYIFINIALDVALVLIITTALITVSCFFLGFGAFGATTAIARQAIDTVIGYCMKLLGYYLVISAGLKTFSMMTDTSFLPTTPEALEQGGLDSYAWLIAVAWLFYLVAKNLPDQMARIVSSGIQESRGVGMAAMVLSTLKLATQSMSPQKGSPTELAGRALKNIAQKAAGLATGGAGYVAKMFSKAADGAQSGSNTGGSHSGQNAPSSKACKPRSVPKP